LTHQVYLLQEAEDDLFDIYRYVAKHDSVSSAEYLFEKLKSTCRSLDELPQRGHVPPELERVGVSAYLELHFKPYRVVYEIDGKKVFVHCVLDGRRDMQSLLERRLIR